MYDNKNGGGFTSYLIVFNYVYQDFHLVFMIYGLFILQHHLWWICFALVTLTEHFPKQEIVELAGYTSRVAHMLEVFEQVEVGQYQRTTVAAKSVMRAPGLQYANGQLIIKGTDFSYNALEKAFWGVSTK